MLGTRHRITLRGATVLTALVFTVFIGTVRFADASPIRSVRHVVIVNTMEDPLLAADPLKDDVYLAEKIATDGGIIRGRLGTASWAFPAGAVRDIIEVPDLGADFTRPEQFAQANACLDVLSGHVEARPQIRDVLLPLGRELKTIVDSGDEGLVRRDGEWGEPGMAESGDAPDSTRETEESTPREPEWEPTSIDDVASCSLLVKVLDKVGKEGEQQRGGGSAFLCNVDGATYIYSNVHNFDGTRDFVIVDREGRKYTDFESVEIAAQGEGFAEELGWGGDVIRLRLPEYHPRALTLAEETVTEEDIDTPIVVTGNTKARGEITKLTGKITGIEPDRIIRHNAKTQGGNSGSPIVDTETFRVIGILTWGSYPE